MTKKYAQPSHLAIDLKDVGVTAAFGFTGVTIGDLADGFNLFDAHGYFIRAENCNVTLQNNVFQNTKIYDVPTATLSVYTPTGGLAVGASATNLMNCEFNMAGTSPANGNRFWNCQYAFSGSNIFKFNSQYNMFRSTQTSTALPAPNFIPPGQGAINIASNRFQYLVRYNEFTNISHCINFPLASGAYSTIASGTATGIYASLIGIVQNTFSPGTGTGNYVSNAVNISCVNAFTPVVITNTNVSPPASGIIIENNVLTDVFRGFNINGVVGLHTEVRSNSISLTADNVISSTQYGIKVTNGISATSSGFYTTIHQNSVTGSGTSTPNPGESLFYLGMNKGINTPSVCCNEAELGHSAFTFDSDNSDAVWAGNVMKPMIRGLVLTSTAEIGPQGDNSTSSYNTWAGTWQANTHYGTYAVTGSTAGLSPLWCANANMFPPNNSGDIGWPFPNWYDINNNNLVTSSGGDYNCISIPNNITIPIPTWDKYENATTLSIYQNLLYRTLHLDTDISDADRDLGDYYTSLAGSKAAEFMAIEEHLFGGDYTEARTLNNSIEAEEGDACEVSYKEFYRLYSNYLEDKVDGEHFGEEDSLALLSLALLCPGNNGPAVYQANALYNYIYGLTLQSGNCGEGSGEKKAHPRFDQVGKKSHDSWNVEVFPNPAQAHISFRGSGDDDVLQVTISDVSGRLILSTDVQLESNHGVLPLPFKEGLYFVTINCSGHEKLVKKVVVAK